MAACSVMIAYHVGSKAARDTLFLLHFDITSLPTMVIVAALFSIAAVFATSRLMTRMSPGRLVPRAFAASAVLHVAMAALITVYPRATAVALYLQSVALGALLTSGFWSLINERYDPRQVKLVVARIAGAGTLGGMLGGVLAERIATWGSVNAMLPVLAVYHLLCAASMRALAVEQPASRLGSDDTGPSGIELLTRTPYLRTLAQLVIAGTMSAAMLDFVFKSQALAGYGRGENLLRFFALFYAISGALTFALQAGLGSYLLRRLGMARTVGTLPFAVSLGGLTALILPSLATATLARGLEAVFRGSLFRAGYEVFYAPMPKQEKRAAKSVVDVAFDRFGDAIGSGLVSLLLILGPAISQPAILTVAVLVAVAGVWVASRLQGAYVDALEHGLLERGGDLALPSLQSEVALSGLLESMTLVDPPTLSRSALRERSAAVQETRPAPTPGPATLFSDIVIQHTAQLRSGSVENVLKVLEQAKPPKPYMIPHLIGLLGWDRVSSDVVEVLRLAVDNHSGQMIDALTDPATDFTIKRRLPRVLSAAATPRVAQGVLTALSEKRFEVRYQCGRALAAMMNKNPYLKFDAEQVLGYVRREVAVSRPVWEGHRLLDRAEEPDATPLVGDYLRDRANKSLQHLFTLLALVFPAEPLRIAFHGLHSPDTQLRGTALEYLDSILPPDIRERLWPLIEGPRGSVRFSGRPKEEVLAELMRSNQTLEWKVEDASRPSTPKTKPE